MACRVTVWPDAEMVGKGWLAGAEGVGAGRARAMPCPTSAEGIGAPWRDGNRAGRTAWLLTEPV